MQTLTLGGVYPFLTVLDADGNYQSSIMHTRDITKIRTDLGKYLDIPKVRETTIVNIINQAGQVTVSGQHVQPAHESHEDRMTISNTTT